jgi:hypothetical protein
MPAFFFLKSEDVMRLNKSLRDEIGLCPMKSAEDR